MSNIIINENLERDRINVNLFGAKGDGKTDSGKAINEAIVYAKENGYKKVIIPAGLFIIEETIIVDGITLEGIGSETILKQKDNTILNSIIHVKSSFPVTYNTILRDLKIDGGNNENYSTNSSLIGNNGIVLDKAHYCKLENIEIRNMGRDGIILTGESGGNWNNHCSTNKVFNINVYGCGRHPILFEVAANDNHFYQCDIGDNNYEVKFSGGSNTLSDSVIWGTRLSKGILINAQQTIIRDCNIEGNAMEGISITAYGSHSKLSGIKFMANSKKTPSKYSDIYIAGESNINVENILISDNLFKGSSLDADGSGYTAKAIIMEPNHNGINISSCKTDYNTKGSIQNLDVLQIQGLKSGDEYNNVTLVDKSFNGKWDDIPQGKILLDTDTGFMKYSNYNLKSILDIGKNNEKVLFENLAGVWKENTEITLDDSISKFSHLKVHIRFSGDDIKILDFNIDGSGNQRRVLDKCNAYDSGTSYGTSIGEIQIDKIGENKLKIINNIYRVYYNSTNVNVYKNNSDCISIRKIVGVY